MQDLVRNEPATSEAGPIAEQSDDRAEPIRSRPRPVRTVRPLQYVNHDLESPLDITLNESLATAMNWSVYFTLSKVEQALMLERVFHDGLKAKNARRIMSRLTNHEALLELVNGPQA